jgi:hypothetical protein
MKRENASCRQILEKRQSVDRVFSDPQDLGRLADGETLVAGDEQPSLFPGGENAAGGVQRRARDVRIAEGYEARGVPEEEAERRAWATVNKESGGGKKSGSGRGQRESHASSRKGGRIGGEASASRPASARSASAKKAAATRERHAAHRG